MKVLAGLPACGAAIPLRLSASVRANMSAPKAGCRGDILMANVLFYPALPSRPLLLDQLFRAVWHFLPALQKLDRLIFPYCGDDFALLDADQTLAAARAYLSRDFDPAIADYAPRFRGKIQFLHTGAGDLSDVAGQLPALSTVIVWNLSDPRFAAVGKQIADRHRAELVLADPAVVQQETLLTLRGVHKLFEQRELHDLVNESYRRFSECLKLWKGQTMSLFGNGPSLAKVVAAKAPIRGHLRAICNSTIGDLAALEHLKPQLMFCGDPVQHCGVSLYAGRFRADLARAMEEPGRILFTQLGYVPYFREALPAGAHDRVIGIGNDRRPQFNIDLDKEFLTAATANIFTMIVLPVALTISKEIDIYGCDGMSFAAATKPWSHANEDDYMGKMAVTHRVHAGFWKRNYEEEFWSYCKDMEDILSLASARGAAIHARTASYVPALAKRFKAL